MSDPVRYQYVITSPTAECVQPPPLDKEDPCRVGVTTDNKQIAFNLYREKGTEKFTVIPQDAATVARSYPAYRPPQRKLKEFLEVSRHFFEQFGDRNNIPFRPDEIRLLTTEQLYEASTSLVTFISQGNIEPGDPLEIAQQMHAVGNGVALFADPKIGNGLENILSRISTSTTLSGEAKERARYVQSALDLREKFWNLMSPKLETKYLDLYPNDFANLNKILKGASLQIIQFLYINHYGDDAQVKKEFLAGNVIDRKQDYHDTISKIDPNYSVDQNYLVQLVQTLKSVRREAQVPSKLKKVFFRKLNLVIGLLETEAKEETKRLIPYEKNQLKAFSLSILAKYGNTSDREIALGIILNHLKIESQNGRPKYGIPMTPIDRELRDWVMRQPTPEKRKAATEAILYAIDQLLERGETIEAFWNGKYQTVPSFFDSENFGKSLLGGNNNRILQELIGWAKGEADKQNITLLPGEDPHVHLRKWTLLGELGVAGAAAGTYFIPYSNPQTQWYGRGGSVILAGSGLGAAAGNFLSYKLDANKNAWLYDVGGAIIGGVISGLIYGLTTSQPGMAPGDRPIDMTPPNDPGKRNPVDEYGP